MKARRAARWLAWAFALTLVGYPLAGLAAVFAGLPSWATSYPFRVAVVALSVWLLVRATHLRPRGHLATALVAFWALYVGRLLFDIVSGPPGAFDALFFFALTTLVPVGVLARLMPHWDEELAARAVFLIGAAICGGGVLIGTGLISTDRQLDITTRLFLDTVNPVTFGHVAASTLIAAGALAYRQRRSMPLPTLAAGACAALGCLLLAGSRGPILSLAICAIAVVLLQRRFGLLLAIGALGTLLVSTGEVEVVARFQDLQSDEVDASALERLVLQANAIEIFLANPVLGGAFAEHELYSYPHNVFLETAMALGAVGLFLLIGLTLATLVRGHKGLRSGQMLLPLLFLQYLVGFQFSGSLWGSSGFWVCMALLLSRRRRRGASPAVAPVRVTIPPIADSPS